ncbi:MAG: hypothetical protein PHV93_00830 [Candidatus Pacebacteria bacterium]|nr:hypothetical protein [Candidatus Paceibacterota bacterium]
MLEKTQSRIYHIHLDTDTRSKALHEKIQQELGFFAHHFTGHPAGYDHYEPTAHSSIKLFSKKDFEKKWQQCLEIVNADKKVIGYMEGEYIPTDEAIPFSPVKKFFKPHWKIKGRRLDSTRGEVFRETEFHLVMDSEKSDQRLVKALFDSGLYGANLTKKGKAGEKNWKAVVITIQGHNRFIKHLIDEVKWYLHQVGGAVHCTIKEEVALKNQRFRKPVEGLPVIIDKITYQKTW